MYCMCVAICYDEKGTGTNLDNPSASIVPWYMLSSTPTAKERTNSTAIVSSLIIVDKPVTLCGR